MNSDTRTNAVRFTTLTVSLLVVAMALGTAAVATDDSECTAAIHYENGTVEEIPATVDENGLCTPDYDTLAERGVWENTTDETDGQS